MLGKQIETLRRKKGWSQAELARRLNISASAVGMYEQGRREPSLDILIALSEELGVTIDFLVTGKHCANLYAEIEAHNNAVDAFNVLKNLSREEMIVLLATKLIAH
jgi:transcriptional regulator with XRE-family HTH domain